MFNPYIFDDDIGKKLYSVRHSDDSKKDIRPEHETVDKIRKRTEDREPIDYSCWAFCK
jgi:hypothetical protein